MLKNKKYCKLKYCSNYTFRTRVESIASTIPKKGELVVDKHPIGLPTGGDLEDQVWPRRAH